MRRNSFKLILILAACTVPLVAAIVNAEQAVRPGNENSASTESRTTQGYLDLVGPQHNRDRDEAANSEAINKIASDAQGVNGLGAEERPGWSTRTSDAPEHGWIIVLGVAGLATSLCAAAYIVWSREKRSQEPITVLMPHARPKVSDGVATLPMTERDAKPGRRAA
jgi:hypothetical protein